MSPSRSSKKASAGSPKANPCTDWPLIDLVLASRARTVYLYGPPGIGKTYSAYHRGRIQDGVYAITLTEDTPAAELRGHYLPVGSEMIWRDGPLIEAMRDGARLVINEVTHGSPEAMTFLHPVLESIATARLTLPTNETVQPAAGFHVVCTDNAPPEELPPALRDRFECAFEINDPHPEALEALEEPYRTAARRTLALEEDRRVSLRAWFAVQELAQDLGQEAAFRAVFGPERGARLLDGLALMQDRNGAKSA